MKYKDYEELSLGSHYDYLDDHLEAFWLQVFGKTPAQMNCGGIVAAHGDKVYCYQRDLEEHGIDFGRGAMLYLLSYLKLDREKSTQALEWIIDNFSKYLPMLKAAEDSVHAEDAQRYQKIVERTKRIYGESYETKEL